MRKRKGTRVVKDQLRGTPFKGTVMECVLFKKDEQIDMRPVQLCDSDIRPESPQVTTGRSQTLVKGMGFGDRIKCKFKGDIL